MTDERTAALGSEIVERIRNIPGVESIGLTNALPLGNYSLAGAVAFERSAALTAISARRSTACLVTAKQCGFKEVLSVTYRGRT